MKTEGSPIKKMCSFYVSDWHLATMMLPYISKLAEEGVQIETILEQGIEKNIKELISRLNMKPDRKQQILDINWNATESNKTQGKQEEIEKQRVILINGTKERIKKINDLLEIELKPKEKEKTTIINCYDVENTQDDMEEILSQHESVINTLGKCEIKEVFPFFKV